jgi:hypothetical protein
VKEHWLFTFKNLRKKEKQDDKFCFQWTLYFLRVFTKFTVTFILRDRSAIVCCCFIGFDVSSSANTQVLVEIDSEKPPW